MSNLVSYSRAQCCFRGCEHSATCCFPIGFSATATLPTAQTWTSWLGAFHPAYRLDARLRVLSELPDSAQQSGRAVVHGFAGVGSAVLETQ